MHRSLLSGALRTGALLLALAGFAGAVWAQSAPSAANVKIAREIVLASGASRAFEGAVPSIMKQALSIFMQQNPDLQKDLIATAEALRPEFEKRAVEIVDIIARSYASRFNEAELKALLAFYTSDVGKKFVAQLPAVLEESFVRTQEWGGKLSEEVVARMRAEMKKKGHAI
jgi:hypothetical protein